MRGLGKARSGDCAWEESGGGRRQPLVNCRHLKLTKVNARGQMRLALGRYPRERPMSWCDKLGSTPSIGYQLDWHALPTDILLNALSPVLDRMVSGDEQRFSIDLKEALKLTFTSYDGFQFGFEPSKIFVGFTHRAELRTGSGGIPTLILSSKPSAYTSLLAEIQQYLLDAMESVNRLKPRRLTGIGVVSTTSAMQDEIPPGIQKLLTYVGNPWSGKLQALTFQAQTILDENNEYSHRCIHTIIKTQKEDDPVQLVFDCQRVYRKPQDTDTNRLRAATEGLKTFALDYFEQLAQGDRFDDVLDNDDNG